MEVFFADDTLIGHYALDNQTLTSIMNIDLENI